MQKELLKSKPLTFIAISFIIGTSLITGISKDVQQDTWLALLIGMVMAIGISLIYSRIMKLYPETDIFDILDRIFGKIVGKIFSLFFIFYSAYLGSVILCNLSAFITVTTLEKTPKIMIIIMVLTAIIYLGRSSLEALAKWSIIATFIVISIVVFTLIASIPYFNIENIQPVLTFPLGKIFGEGFNIFAFPFAETVIILSIAGSLKKGEKPIKIYVLGILIAGLVVITVFFRNIIMLGPESHQTEIFPSYSATRVINIADFLARIEGMISVNFILGVITKSTLCAIATAKGITKLFSYRNYKDLIVPSALISLTISAFSFQSSMEMFRFIRIYAPFAFPFQVILPIIVWIAAEIRHFIDKKKNMSNNTNNENDSQQGTQQNNQNPPPQNNTNASPAQNN